MYLLTVEDYTEAIIQAKQNGLEVKVITDGTPLQKDTKAAAQARRLYEAGVDVRLVSNWHTHLQ